MTSLRRSSSCGRCARSCSSPRRVTSHRRAWNKRSESSPDLRQTSAASAAAPKRLPTFLRIQQSLNRKLNVDLATPTPDLPAHPETASTCSDEHAHTDNPSTLRDVNTIRLSSSDAVAVTSQDKSEQLPLASCSDSSLSIMQQLESMTQQLEARKMTSDALAPTQVSHDEQAHAASECEEADAEAEVRTECVEERVDDIVEAGKVEPAPAVSRDSVLLFATEPHS